MFSLLLRVLLSIGLIANGAGYAEASTRMAFEHAAHTGATPATDTVASTDVPPCHRASRRAAAQPAMHHAGHVATSHGSSHAASVEADRGKVASKDDCCNGKTCRCACAHASCATMVQVAAQVVVLPAVRVPTFAVAHPQPRLPHLTRPPIG